MGCSLSSSRASFHCVRSRAPRFVFGYAMLSRTPREETGARVWSVGWVAQMGRAAAVLLESPPSWKYPVDCLLHLRLEERHVALHLRAKLPMR